MKQRNYEKLSKCFNEILQDEEYSEDFHRTDIKRAIHRAYNEACDHLDDTDLQTKQGFTEYVKRSLVEYRNLIREEACAVPNFDEIARRLTDRSGEVETDKRWTIERMFQPKNKTALDLFTLVNVCEILGIHISDVLPPVRRFNCDPKIFWESEDEETGRVKALPERFYEGTYHTYYFAPMQMQENDRYGQSATQTQKIKHAILSLKRNQGITEAVLTELKEDDGFSPATDRENLVLRGNARLFVYLNQVHIELMDPQGLRYMNINFPFIHLATDKLYSQEGALLSISTEQTRYPVLQKIVLCRNAITKRDENVIRGILSMSDNEIIVRRDAWENLVDTNPLVKRFAYSEVTSSIDGTPAYYVYHEDKLHIWYRENRDNGSTSNALDYSCFMKALMELRNASISAPIYKIREHDRFNIFSMNLQKGQIPE